MSYAFVQDVPVTEDLYRQIKSRLGEEAPAGLVAHVVIKRDRGLRYVDVWETQADWDRFRSEQVDPAVGAVLAGAGIPRDQSLVHFRDVEVIDTWLGTGGAAAG